MKVSPVSRLKLVFLGLFAVGCVAVWGYQAYYVWPKDRCEAHGAWWDPQTRICATPIYLPNVTGRPLGSPPLNSGPPPAPTRTVIVSSATGKPVQPQSGQAQTAPRVAPGVQSTSPKP